MMIRQFLRWTCILGLGTYLVSCQKTGINDFAKYTPPSPDTTRDVKAILAQTPFTLFRQAARKVGLDSLLPGTAYFTIFAPVDSAMQAAGLDSVHISALSADSLKQIVFYHVVSGTYNTATLTAAPNSVQAPSLRQDISYDNLQNITYVYQQNLYIKQMGSVYINGETVNSPDDTAFSASNGYIWPIRTVLQAPGQSVWKILLSKPELSMYVASLRMDDSIYEAYGWISQYNGYTTSDTLIFSTVNYANQTPANQGNGNPYAMPTVFAPTNAAFEAAGFHTYADLLAFATRTPPFAGYVYDPNQGQYVYIKQFATLDSVMKLQSLINTSYIFSNLSFYNDFLFNADINNGGFNINSYLPQPPLMFSNAGNTVHIQWSPTAPAAVLSADKSGHFMATNGVIYEINQLFYQND